MATVSVVVPTYNRAAVLGACIESVLEQTFKDWELLIVDDGSCDRTEALVGGYDDPRIRYLFQSNRGANAARMTGVDAASGSYVSFLDSDDRLHPTYLAIAVDRLEREPDRCAGIATSYRELTPTGRVTYVNRTPARRIGLEDISDGNVIGSFSATTFRRDIFDAVGGLDLSLPAAQDYEFYLRVLETGHYIRGIADVLVDRVRTPDRISGDIDRRKEAYAYLNEKHGDTLSAKRIADQHYMLGFMHAEAGEFSSAAAAFRSAIEHNPRNLFYYYHYLSARSGALGWDLSLAAKHAINRAVYRVRRGSV